MLSFLHAPIISTSSSEWAKRFICFAVYSFLIRFILERLESLFSLSLQTAPHRNALLNETGLATGGNALRHNQVRTFLVGRVE